MTKKALNDLCNKATAAVKATLNAADEPGCPLLDDDEARTILGMTLRKRMRSLVAEATGEQEENVLWGDETNEDKPEAKESPAEAATEPATAS